MCDNALVVSDCIMLYTNLKLANNNYNDNANKN